MRPFRELVPSAVAAMLTQRHRSASTGAWQPGGNARAARRPASRGAWRYMARGGGRPYSYSRNPILRRRTRGDKRTSSPRPLYDSEPRTRSIPASEDDATPARASSRKQPREILVRAPVWPGALARPGRGAGAAGRLPAGSPSRAPTLASPPAGRRCNMGERAVARSGGHVPREWGAAANPPKSARARGTRAAASACAPAPPPCARPPQPHVRCEPAALRPRGPPAQLGPRTGRPTGQPSCQRCRPDPIRRARRRPPRTPRRAVAGVGSCPFYAGSNARSPPRYPPLVYTRM
jgi:hypothetical protein